MEDIRTARCSDDVYPTMEKVNASLLRVAASTMNVSEDEAAAKLQQKLMLPVRKPAKGMALVVSYQYIKRVVGHLNSSLTSVAVAAFVKHMHTLKGMGSWSSRTSSSARRVLKLSAEECSELLRNDSFVIDSCGRLAMLEALTSVIEEVGGTSLMVAWSGPNKTSRVIRCLFGHFANVSFRVSWSYSLAVLGVVWSLGADRCGVLAPIGVVSWRRLHLDSGPGACTCTQCTLPVADSFSFRVFTGVPQCLFSPLFSLTRCERTFATVRACHR